MKKLAKNVLMFWMMLVFLMGFVTLTTAVGQTQMSVTSEENVFAPKIPLPLNPEFTVYVDNNIPFGRVEYDYKLRRNFRIIETSEVIFGEGFVSVLIGGKEPQRVFIPNAKVLWVIQR